MLHKLKRIELVPLDSGTSLIFKAESYESLVEMILGFSVFIDAEREKGVDIHKTQKKLFETFEFKDFAISLNQTPKVESKYKYDNYGELKTELTEWLKDDRNGCCGVHPYFHVSKTVFGSVDEVKRISEVLYARVSFGHRGGENEGYFNRLLADKTETRLWVNSMLLRLHFSSPDFQYYVNRDSHLYQLSEAGAQFTELAENNGLSEVISVPTRVDFYSQPNFSLQDSVLGILPSEAEFAINYKLSPTFEKYPSVQSRIDWVRSLEKLSRSLES